MAINVYLLHVPTAVQLNFLPSERVGETASCCADYTDREENLVEHNTEEDNSDFVLEAVGYTNGDHSPASYRLMKATALAHCLDGRQISEQAPALTNLIRIWKSNPYAKPSNHQQKAAVKLLNRLKFLAKDVKGSSGYKQCWCNEIYINHFLVSLFGDVLPEERKTLSILQSFINTILKYGSKQPGLFGVCDTYYGMVEAQGRDKDYKTQISTWLESIIQCELPGMMEVVIDSPDHPLQRPPRAPDQLDPRLADWPILSEDNVHFAQHFQDFVTDLALTCNWHKHTDMFWKHLRPGEPCNDSHRRMQINGSTHSLTELDSETQGILLWRLHPKINNFNDIVIFLLKCNMDIKYVGSGEAAKALLYYISDYITKSTLPVHVGLDALRYAIKQNKKKFPQSDDTPELVRSQSLFTKSVNAIMARQEMSHQQVMSYLIGGGDCYCVIRWSEFDQYMSSHFAGDLQSSSSVEDDSDVPFHDNAGHLLPCADDQTALTEEISTRFVTRMDVCDYDLVDLQHPEGNSCMNTHG
ncbi:hypothetical protein SERLADRAFT_412311 [Serpula lacrymans var. lacrymans S7.9]|uniref:Uncharacterized protein n=1 Tax=Serpula lacrymans var. lacrymans (strain S7.9) TaxID=578457 RepID=F8NDC4_SERL9|nr:uncharacterized protein SERLADRAFT_412311 [Serpula lacrymans var. lacrymans S7.9]EGO30262.1 hypothetical protein SERLADRAFT_412311 [Serpula lacrymans var. lacrymans S7.9]